MHRIGNRLAVSMEALRTVCQKTHAAAVDALSSSKTSLAVAHNAYLTHTLLGIFLATAGRPVNDPFHTIDLFNLEEGLGILIDKVSDRSKEARLVVMPQEAVRQLRHWLVHLQALAARLSREHRELAAQIYAIAQPGFGRAIPLFFLLKDDLSGIERIGLKEYQAMLRPYWTLPANFQRACLLTWLREHGCPAELVDMQLGHASAGNTPFGLATAHAPLEFRDILRPYLDRYLTATGWQSLPGLVSTRVRCFSSVLKLAQRLKTDHGLGPGSRAAARKILWARDAQFVITLLQQYFPAAFDEHNPGGLPAGFPREIGDETVRQIVDSIFEPADGGEERTLLRFQLLRRYLARLRRHGVRVTLPGRMVAINPEPTPFNAETLVLARRAESLRQRFIDHLEQQGKLGKAPEPAQRVAEILIAAPLFSALQSRRALEALPVALQNVTYFGMKPCSSTCRWASATTALCGAGFQTPSVPR